MLGSRVHGMLLIMMFQESNKNDVAFMTSRTKHLRLALLVSLILGLCAVAFPDPTALGSWEARFAQPPSDARILKIIHNWPDQPNAQDGHIRRLRA